MLGFNNSFSVIAEKQKKGERGENIFKIVDKEGFSEKEEESRLGEKYYKV